MNYSEKVLFLLKRLKADLLRCEDKGCIESVLNFYITLIEEKGIEELEYELGLPRLR